MQILCGLSLTTKINAFTAEKTAVELFPVRTASGDTRVHNVDQKYWSVLPPQNKRMRFQTTMNVLSVLLHILMQVIHNRFTRMI